MIAATAWPCSTPRPPISTPSAPRWASMRAVASLTLLAAAGDQDDLAGEQSSIRHRAQLLHGHLESDAGDAAGAGHAGPLA